MCLCVPDIVRSPCSNVVKRVWNWLADVLSQVKSALIACSVGAFLGASCASRQFCSVQFFVPLGFVMTERLAMAATAVIKLEAQSKSVVTDISKSLELSEYLPGTLTKPWKL